MAEQTFSEKGPLNGNYLLKNTGGVALPEEFLTSFEGSEFYDSARMFVRRVDNDTGIPFLLYPEYECAKSVLPAEFLPAFEKLIISPDTERVYLRGINYYLNFHEFVSSATQTEAQQAFGLVKQSIETDLKLLALLRDVSGSACTLEERMVVGSFLDLCKHHFLILFTGLYESMKHDESIDVSIYHSARSAIDSLVSEYYRFVLEGGPVCVPINGTETQKIVDSVESVVHRTSGIYHRKRYLAREFDHPGRMVMYSSHLLSQIRDKRKRYDLLVNLLNGSAEMGVAIQAIDSLLGTKNISSTVVFEVDFARYSKKDEEDEDVTSYSQFERIAVPKQLRQSFRDNVDKKDVLIVDDNINTGSSLYNVRFALEEVASSVDISVAEITPPERIPKDLPVMLTESDLTFSPIAWWRDQRELNRMRIIPKILGL